MICCEDEVRERMRDKTARKRGGWRKGRRRGVGGHKPIKVTRTFPGYSPVVGNELIARM